MSTTHIDLIRRTVQTVRLLGAEVRDFRVSDLLPPDVKMVGPIQGTVYIAREEWFNILKETEVHRDIVITPGGDVSTVFLGIPVRGL